MPAGHLHASSTGLDTYPNLQYKNELRCLLTIADSQLQHGVAICPPHHLLAPVWWVAMCWLYAQGFDSFFNA